MGSLGMGEEESNAVALHESALWFSPDVRSYQDKAPSVGVMSTENFDIKPISTAEEDVAAMMAGN